MFMMFMMSGDGSESESEREREQDAFERREVKMGWELVTNYQEDA